MHSRTARSVLLLLGVLLAVPVTVASGPVMPAGDAVPDAVGAAEVADAPGVSARAQRAAAILRGQVVDPRGNPVEDVGVAVDFQRESATLHVGQMAAGNRRAFTEVGKARDNFDTHTDAEGNFSRPSLQTDVEYTVHFEKEGYIPYERVVVLHTGVNEMDPVVLRRGDVEKARESYEEGYEAYSAGRWAEADEAMGRVVEAFGEADDNVDPMLVVALAVAGQSRLRLGKLEAAEAALQRLLELAPDDVNGHAGMGHVRASQGDFANAREHFGRAVELAPENAANRCNLGSVLLAQGEAAGAEEQLLECLELDESMAQAHRDLGRLYANTGRGQEAVEHLEAYLEAMPNAPDADRVRALLERLQG